MVSIIRDLLRGIIAALPPREAFETTGVSARHGSRAGLGGAMAWSVMRWALRNSLKHLIRGNEGAQDRFFSLDGRDESRMQPVLVADSGDTGNGEGPGSWEDIGGSLLGPCCAS